MTLPQRDENVVLSVRNIPMAKVQHVSSINVIELLKHDYVVMPIQTVRWIEMVFGEGISAEEASLKIAEASETADAVVLDEEANDKVEESTASDSDEA